MERELKATSCGEFKELELFNKEKGRLTGAPFTHEKI